MTKKVCLVLIAWIPDQVRDDKAGGCQVFAVIPWIPDQVRDDKAG
ncbi:hypothetical protein N9357_05880 [bacterium]|nr:hypothetical protein [bacterium]